MIGGTFFQRKTGNHFFPKASCLFCQNLTIFLFVFLFLKNPLQKFDYLPGLRLFILIPRIMRKLGIFNYDLRNIGEQITSRNLKGTRLPPSSASLTS